MDENQGPTPGGSHGAQSDDRPWSLNRRTIGSARPTGSPLVQLALLVPDASFAIARELQRAAFGICGFGTRRSAAVIGAVSSTPVMARPLALVEARVAPIARQARNSARPTCFGSESSFSGREPMLVEVIERVVEILPIDAILARIDVDALLRRVDVDGIVSRVDIDGIVARVDLQGIVAEVLAGIEIGDLIHDSTNSIASDVAGHGPERSRVHGRRPDRADRRSDCETRARARSRRCPATRFPGCRDRRESTGSRRLGAGEASRTRFVGCSPTAWILPSSE